MVSDGDDNNSRKLQGSLRCLQISVFIYGVLNMLVRGAELVLAIISSSVIVAAYVTGISHPSTFHEYLHEEARHAIWRGPYPSAVMEAHKNISKLTAAANNSSNETTEMMPMSLPDFEINAFQEKVNLHVWTMYFLMKCITISFAWLLISSAKRFSFSGNLAWLAYSIPVLAQYLLQFILDLSLGDYFLRELPSQIWQGVDIGFQLIGVIVVSIFLYQLYHLDEKIPGIDRYTGFSPARLNGDISITEIIEDDQRFKANN